MKLKIVTKDIKFIAHFLLLMTISNISVPQ